MSAQKPFVKLEEDIFQDPKIRCLLRKGGYEAFGLYCGLLTIFRRYKSLIYRIPYDDIPDLAEWDLHCTAESLNKAVDLCVEVGLFMDDGVLFWSERRVKDLLEQDQKSLARAENAAATNAKRKANKNKNPISDTVGALVAKTNANA